MTSLIAQNHLTILKKYDFVESEIFQDYLNFLEKDALDRLKNGGQGPYQAIAVFKN